MLSWGTRKIYITTAEAEALERVYQAYTERMGVPYGFVSELLDIDGDG
jgi:hypothetical protein